MRRSLSTLSLLVLPSIAFAQRGGGSAATKHDVLDTTHVPQGPTLRVRDVEDLSPLRMFIDKHKDLKLTDPQTDQLKTAEKTLHDKNAGSFKAIDSLVGVMRQAANGNSDADRGRGTVARAAVMVAIGDIDANNDTAAKEQMVSFNPDQLTKAKELLDHQAEDEKKMLKDRLGGGRGRGGN